MRPVAGEVRQPAPWQSRRLVASARSCIGVSCELVVAYAADCQENSRSGHASAAPLFTKRQHTIRPGFPELIDPLHHVLERLDLSTLLLGL